ncbi:unnamed protein product, partial [Urochloa humidicola]
PRASRVEGKKGGRSRKRREEKGRRGGRKRRREELGRKRGEKEEEEGGAGEPTRGEKSSSREKEEKPGAVRAKDAATPELRQAPPSHESSSSRRPSATSPRHPSYDPEDYIDYYDHDYAGVELQRGVQL